ncbi:MAG: ABC transporter ATP-binding protein [Clostridia bacterium]|nr:ABC transporter ATP-binding protein [Clostridia bacterium]
MKRTLVYLKDYKKECVLGPLFKLLEASFELFVPLIMAAIIDTGISHRDSGYIIRMGLLLVTLSIVGLVCSITAQFFAAKAATGFAAKLKHALFSYIQGLSYTEIDTLGTSTMITRMTSDVNQVQTGVNLLLRLVLRSPFVVFGAMIMAFIVDAGSALIFVVAIPLLAAVVFAVMLTTIPLYRGVQLRLDDLLGTTRENLTGVRVIRAFCKEEDELEQFARRNDALNTAQRYVGRISAIMNPATYVIINIAIVALIWVGAVRVDNALLTQGEVVALYNYMSLILVELIKLANLIITMTKSVACANRIGAVFDTASDETSDLRDGADAEGLRASVEFRDVSMRYKGAGDDTLSGISFAAAPGETIGIIGGTGSGKSSLVNLIPRFYEASQGQVLIGGRDVRDYDTEALRDKIGIVPQKSVLFSGTIRDNMRWGRNNASDDEIWEALTIAQAKEVVEGKEEGLDCMVAQQGKNFSGGQRQRLTIARALVRKPDILILDDSASALDYATDARLRAALQGMAHRPTVFSVSQRAASIRHADRIIVLDDGEMVGIGTHDELMRDCAVYSEIYYSQIPKEA